MRDRRNLTKTTAAHHRFRARANHSAGVCGSERVGPRNTVKDRLPCSSTPSKGCADDDEPWGCPGRGGLRMTTNERPVSWLGGGGWLSGASLSLIRRFFRLLYQCFFFGCVCVADSSFMYSTRALCSGALFTSTGLNAGAFSMTAVWDFVRICAAGGIAPGGRPRAALAMEGETGGESSTTEGEDFASDPRPMLRSRSTDGNVCVEPDAMA